MKIAQLMTGTNQHLENRKRALQRREAGDAYKKNAQYQEKKNPMLEVLENLLSGRTEKELHAADQAKREFGTPISKQDQPEMTEKEVIVQEQVHKEVGGEVSVHVKEGTTPGETLEILEKVKAAALAPANPSPQDLRVAASATTQIQQTRAEMTKQEEDVEPFAGVDTNIEVPKRFMNNFEERDATQGTLLLGHELERLLYERTFQKASRNYSHHIDMVKNGYRPFGEPTFSQIA